MAWWSALRVGESLQVTKSLKPGGRGFERDVRMLRNTKQVLGSFATR
jgi:hypothetical protein